MKRKMGSKKLKIGQTVFFENKKYKIEAIKDDKAWIKNKYIDTDVHKGYYHTSCCINELKTKG